MVKKALMPATITATRARHDGATGDAAAGRGGDGGGTVAAEDMRTGARRRRWRDLPGSTSLARTLRYEKSIFHLF
jgi:hypothetical protein